MCFSLKIGKRRVTWSSHGVVGLIRYKYLMFYAPLHLMHSTTSFTLHGQSQKSLISKTNLMYNNNVLEGNINNNVFHPLCHSPPLARIVLDWRSSNFRFHCSRYCIVSHQTTPDPSKFLPLVVTSFTHATLQSELSKAPEVRKRQERGESKSYDLLCMDKGWSEKDVRPSGWTR